jgi:hypothetical protein
VEITKKNIFVDFLSATKILNNSFREKTPSIDFTGYIYFCKYISMYMSPFSMKKSENLKISYFRVLQPIPRPLFSKHLIFIPLLPLIRCGGMVNAID